MSGDAIFLLGTGGFICRDLAERVANAAIPVIEVTRHENVFSHPDIRNVAAGGPPSSPSTKA